MPYSGDMTWPLWAQQLENQRQQLQQRVDEAFHWQQKWYDFAYGQSDAQIAATLGKTEADVAKIQAAWAALRTIHDVLYGQATVTPAYDFNGALSPF